MREGTVIIFLKAPVAGRVKTRMARDMGFARATSLFRVMTKKTISAATGRDGARAPRWRCILAVDPVPALTGFNTVWPPMIDRIAQGRGTLGDRMRRVINGASNGPQTGPVVIVGSDAPGLQTTHLAKAFALLRGCDAVFGPAHDGGYWLIGLARRRGAPQLFDGVRWSTRHALADTKASLPSGFHIKDLEQLRDVDEVSDMTAVGYGALLRSVKTHPIV